MGAVLFPQGKGMFVFDAARLYGGDTAVLVQSAKDLKLSWVSFKIADGINVFEAAAVAKAVQALQAAGLQTFGWHYVYGRQPANEAAISAERVISLGLHGLMIDAEGEYDQAGTAPAASAYMAGLKAKLDLSAIGVGLCSYRYQTVHREFPWSTFLADCTFHMPQVYWEMDMRPNGPVEQLARSYQELTALRSLPFIPLGIACMDNGFKPTALQIANFNNAVVGLKLPGIGWYEWNAALAQPEVYAAVMATTGWDVVAGPQPLPTAGPGVSDKVVAAYIANQEAMLADLAKGVQGNYVTSI